LSNISIVAILVGLSMVVNNLVPTSRVGFQQFNAFASKAATNAVIAGTLVMI